MEDKLFIFLTLAIMTNGWLSLFVIIGFIDRISMPIASRKLRQLIGLLAVSIFGWFVIFLYAPL